MEKGPAKKAQMDIRGIDSGEGAPEEARFVSMPHTPDGRSVRLAGHAGDKDREGREESQP
jgi:hypothetical protein